MTDLPQLPTHADEYLASLDPVGLIDLMIHDEDRVPRNVIDECARRSDAMIEHLADLVADDIDGQTEGAGKWWLKMHAVMILGLISTERAGLLLVKFMRSMSCKEGEDSNGLQDWLAGYWPALFHNKPESVLPILREFCHDRAVNWYIRVNAIDAVVAAALSQGSNELELALEWLAGIVADEDEDWSLRLCAGNTLLDFPRVQHRPLLDDMAARQGFLGVHFAPNDVQKAYTAMQDEASWERFNDPWKFYLPGEIAARQQRWGEEDAENDPVAWDEDYSFSGNEFLDDGYPFEEPYVRAVPKIGRNDPCPCGSGKKYKKCCLDADEAKGEIF